jgi:acyl-CoA dehydrogenase
MQFCSGEAVQILGGAGFMRGTRSERIYREVKVFMIGGMVEEKLLGDLRSSYEQTTVFTRKYLEKVP